LARESGWESGVQFCRAATAAVAALALLSSSAQAQWPVYRAPGIPRLPDGKPNLSAPPLRTADGKPDLSGIWTKDTPRLLDYFYDLAKDLGPGDVVMTPWAEAIATQREARNHIDDPWGYCAAPPGVPRINMMSVFKILQTPTTTVLLYELDTGAVFRQVFTDGRSLPEGVEPAWLGYSVGQWEGDSFVIRTAGFRDGGWIDTQKARPHSDALRVTERIRRLNIGNMEMTITIDDPKAFVKPWTVRVPFKLIADSELIEGSCDAHEKTMEHRRIDPAPLEPPSPRLR
jgi:hypothetical protein